MDNSYDLSDTNLDDFEIVNLEGLSCEQLSELSNVLENKHGYMLEGNTPLHDGEYIVLHSDDDDTLYASIYISGENDFCDALRIKAKDVTSDLVV